MRFLLIIMGAFVAVVCLAKPTEARDYPWCSYYNFQHGGATNCGKMTRLIFQTLAFIDTFAFKKTTIAYREIDGLPSDKSSLGCIAPTATTGTTATGHSSVQRASSGSFAIFAAIRLASSLVSNFAADLRPGSFS